MSAGRVSKNSLGGNGTGWRMKTRKLEIGYQNTEIRGMKLN
jgi:hypothetical protein